MAAVGMTTDNKILLVERNDELDPALDRAVDDVVRRVCRGYFQEEPVLLVVDREVQIVDCCGARHRRLHGKR